ncbi:hypothetical protein TrLO_g14167 [Triparma laevis f. longispina]|uniref:Uncharacterized protein n=1 Tax=Triparma laevis f. longispina TaxID=1714387 RepID=A0A9W7L0K2_9STRA|nr:hypothetical protein TrLO_g14167 [Triparma laevis f. longispina]
MFNNGVILLKGWCGWIAYVQLAQKSRVERGRKLREGFEKWDCWVLRKKEEEERRERGERGWRRKCFIKGLEVWKEKVENWREEREVERGRICRAEEWRENKLVRKGFSRLEAFRNERRELRDKTRIAEEVNYWKIIQKGFKALTLGVITSKKTNRRIELQSKAVKEEIFDTWKNIVVETKHKHDKVIARILKLRKLKVLETWKERVYNLERREAGFEMFLEKRMLRSGFNSWLNHSDSLAIITRERLSTSFNIFKDNVEFKRKSRKLNKRAVSFLIFNMYSKAWYGIKREWGSGRERRRGEGEREVEERLEGVRKGFEEFRNGEEKTTSPASKTLTHKPTVKLDTSKYELPKFERTALKPVRTLQEIISDVPEWIVDELGKRDAGIAFGGGVVKPQGYVVGVEGNVLDRVRKFNGADEVETTVTEVKQSPQVTVDVNFSDSDIPAMIESAEVDLTGSTSSNISQGEYIDSRCHSPPRIQKYLNSPIMSPLSNYDNNFTRYEEIERLERAMVKLKREKEGLNGQEKKIWKEKYRKMVKKVRGIVEEIKGNSAM